MENDLGHVMAHEEQPTVAGALVFLGREVGYLFGFEPPSFVNNANIKPFQIDTVADNDFFVAVHAIAMLDGVDQRFLHGHNNAENLPVCELKQVRLTSS